jgi:phosphoserine aminotransferase
MIDNFYPGPSALHPYFEEAVQSAMSSGILSMNHRSDAFASLYKSCFNTLQDKWKIPKDYSLLFVSSATETWEIIAQSLIADQPSLHIYNGSFGKKSFEVAQRLTSNAHSFAFDYNQELPIEQLQGYPFINLCQNETSNGTAISNASLQQVRDKCPHSIISVDATSSMGGVYLDFSTADIWYSSVQKCMGLPSGMGIILINKKAIDVIKRKNIKQHYNDFLNIITNAQKWQTTHTPNILNIHALAYTQAKTNMIQQIEKKTITRKNKFTEYLPHLIFLTADKNISSSTVFTIQYDKVNELISSALKENIILGKGYGERKNNTFRIANFPSISDKSFKQLITFFKKEHKKSHF